MLKIIEPRRRVHVVAHYVEFEWRERPGAGFLFPADEAGNPLPPANPAAADNMLLAYTDDSVRHKGAFTTGRHYTEPAVAECYCGKEVILHSGCHCECEHCGRLYNTSGQELRTCYCLPGGRRYLESMGETIDEDW